MAQDDRYLDAGSHAVAKVIGKGNVSEGVRIALMIASTKATAEGQTRKPA